MIALGFLIALGPGLTLITLGAIAAWVMRRSGPDRSGAAATHARPRRTAST
jgi:hypothetical protein